eukprot:2854233-Rhodomonas_salina.1
MAAQYWSHGVLSTSSERFPAMMSWVSVSSGWLVSAALKCDPRSLYTGSYDADSQPANLSCVVAGSGLAEITPPKSMSNGMIQAYPAWIIP